MYASMKDALVEQMAEISNCSAALMFCSETERGWGCWPSIAGCWEEAARESRIPGNGVAVECAAGKHTFTINKQIERASDFTR